MSWSIGLVKNTVKISRKCAEDLCKGARAAHISEWYMWENPGRVASKGYLMFSIDHREHMDYLSNYSFVIRVLKKHKVEGEICFGSLEGDNAGSFWGYRFDGQGGCVALKGSLKWKENKK